MKTKFLTLWLAGIASTILALPYIFALQHKVIEQAPIPEWQIGILAVIQTAVLLGVTVYFGLRLADKIQLPTLTLFTSDTPLKENLKRISALSIPLGITVAVVIAFADRLFIPHIPQLVATAEQIPFWKALLVAPYGGIVEELLLRLFFVSLIAWLLGTLFKTTEVVRNSTIMWTAIILASILFGLGHLPATATILPITPLVVTRAILLNGIGGLVFGWLYWKKGLEYSIVAHFTTDIALHAVLISLMLK